MRFSDETLRVLRALKTSFEAGKLGPVEHEQHPGLPADSSENYLYMTFASALNFQRKSEQLWRAALATYTDESTRFVFRPRDALSNPEATAAALTRHSLATQPNRHLKIWLGLAKTFYEIYGERPQDFLDSCDHDVDKIVAHLAANKLEFPSLCGPKMSNYWLYILHRFTAVKLTNPEAISIIPDTHVRKATSYLGLATPEFCEDPEKVAALWRAGLSGSELVPSDLHAPLWRWSRAGFPEMDIIPLDGALP